MWVKDSSGQTTVTTDSYYLSYDSVSPTISNASTSGRTLTATLVDNKALSGYALSTSNTTTPTSWTSISGTSYSLSYTASSNVVYYLWVKDSSGNTNVSTENYWLTNTTNLVSRMQELVTLGSTSAASDTPGSYTNYRYIGANPNNYVCFTTDGSTCINYTKGSTSSTNTTGGLFRIIGSFGYDTHGQSGQQLVKLITADTLGGTTLIFDYKEGSTSAATASSISVGSNDWSDSQLMYMLNGSVGNNKGYKTTSPTSSTSAIRTLTYSSNSVYYKSSKYFYTNYSGYSYLSGSTTSSRTLNKPANVANGSNYSSSTLTVNSLVPSQTSMIKEVTWHLGGYSSSAILSSEFYTYERGSTVYSTGTTRPYTWIGKIGLMYPSDYGYATSGGTTYNRNACLTSYNFFNWYLYYDCYTNDWLLYPGARTGTQGTATDQWTISPLSSNASNVFDVDSSGYVPGWSGAANYRGVRPAFYVDSSVYVAGGSGTSQDPYLLKMD